MRILDGPDPAAVRVAPDVLRDAEDPRRLALARLVGGCRLDHPQEHLAREIVGGGGIARQPVQEPPDGTAVPVEHPDGDLAGVGCWPHIRIKRTRGERISRGPLLQIQAVLNVFK